MITDPHIKISQPYGVYLEGTKMDVSEAEDESIWVKTQNRGKFIASSWPGDSVWVDFLNEAAQKFWQQQYGFDKFKGLTPLFDFWIDMNEPSVFNYLDGTMPSTNLHSSPKYSRSIYHGEIHNAYGQMMHKTTYEGLVERD